MAQVHRRMTTKTRKVLKCPVFGSPSQLSTCTLPTYADTMKFYLLVKNSLKNSGTGKEPTAAAISEIVAVRIEEVWSRASIPIVIHKRVLQLIRSYHDKYRKLLKPFKGRQNDAKYTEKLNSFAMNAKESLFDIAACKCDFLKCSCSKDRKVPTTEQAFLQDQRALRNMMISTIDREASNKLKNKNTRKNEEATRFARYTENANSNVVTPHGCKRQSSGATRQESTSGTESDDNIPLAELQRKRQYIKKRRYKQYLPTLARACDRHGVSDRSAAAIATAVLQDFGLISKADTSNVVDRNKVRRARQKKRIELQMLAGESNELQSLYFDGRKDHTLTNTQKGSKWYRKKVYEEHISLIEEPGSKYIGHVTPASGSADGIKDSIMCFLKDRCLDTLIAVGCDETNVNTGRIGGTIRLLEEELHKPLQWLVCQLHANELPLRHLLKHVDGGTSGPRAFTGPIGKELSGCEHLPPVAFAPIEGHLQDINRVDLSTDQRYLYEMCKSVSKGHCSLPLSRRDPGALSHSRWLTTANRLLRLYVATENPSCNLTTVVTYIVRVYAPMWFAIKSNPSCKDGSKHLWQTIVKSRYLSDDLKAVIDPVIQRNAYFGHPENLLLCMITDDRQYIRELGMRRILRARSEQYGIRQFKIPQLNFSAADYIDIIDWQSITVTEPPLLAIASEQDIEMFVASGNVPVIDFPKYPCHTQAVERCVKLVTEASAAVCGVNARDGFIRVRLESRQIMPYFNTKSQYRVE
jgi:hypothetical protein